MSRAKPWVIGLIALVVATGFATRVVSTMGWDPTILIGFGDTATPTTEFAEERLGDVYLRVGQGHDGKYFFVQAHDPLILSPEGNAMVLDRPIYRSQRMLYPLLAGGLGFFGSESISWGLMVVNVLALAGGTYATAVIARRMGGSAWWGLAFILNIGLISEANISGAGVVAAAFAFAAVAAYLCGRDGWAVALLCLACLSREVMLLVPLGIAFWLWRDGRRRLSMVGLLVPVAAVASWALYLRLRLGWESGASDAALAFSAPLVGLARALPLWVGSPVDLAAGLAVLLLTALFAYRTFKTNALVGWAFMGFVPLTLVLNERVWAFYYDSTRAVAPLITAFVLMLFLGDRGAATRVESLADKSKALT
jgi:hypothetical protein